MTRVLLDRSTGLCDGVKRTISGALKAAKLKHNVVSYGELIHNPDVTRDLKNSGISVRHRLEELDKSQYVIIRAHGIPPEEEKILKERGISYLDLTCLRVKRIHKNISKKRKLGFKIIIVGDPKHPEVRGHLGYAGADSGVVLSSSREAEFYSGTGKHFVFAQTTTSPDFFYSIIHILKEKGLDLHTMDTLCPFVLKRQEWIAKYSRLTEASLIIGGKNSSNTQKLFEIALENGAAYWIRSAGDLEVEKILKHSSIAFTAGASTPDETIQEVIRKLESGGAVIEIY